MNSNAWFNEGITIRGLRSGLVEVMPEPYSARSAARLARSYAVIWREAIEWWPIGVAPEAWHQPLVSRLTRARPVP